MNKIILLLTFFILVTLPAFAQDISGSKDHPLLTRYPESRITEYEQNYNSGEFTTGLDESGAPIKQKVEGTMTTIRYYYKNAEQQASPLEIIRNYQNAVKNFGGTVLYERLPQEMDGGETTLQATAAGKLHWIKVEPDIYSAPTQSYKLQIVEVQEMKQFISANDYMNELKEKGFVTLYINFDTGKWDLKSDSDVIIKELVTMLQSDSNLKLSIEGHTDNIGSPESNISLSQNRARSVMEALIEGGISQERLTSTGFGQEKPIADNRTEDGRAKNRRVELIKVE